MMKLSDQLKVINRYRKEAPVDVVGIARELGIPVNEAFLDSGISGMIEHDNGSYKISVNTFDPPTRQRFTIAHELGHYMMHRKLINDGIDDDRAYRSTSAGKYFNTAIGPRQETEANQFAADVLMPDSLINELKKQGYTTVRELARTLEVSEHAMSIRLGIPYDG